MKPLDQLINTQDPALPLLHQWLAEAVQDCELLPPSDQRDATLLQLQVSTRSVLGAIAYESGGLLINHGWLRLLGSGHPRLPRSITQWNADRSSGYLLVGDDVVGGFFAINGGALGDDMGDMYYFAPDTQQWEALEIGYSDFVHWALSERLSQFYADLRWSGWEADVRGVGGDQCFNFFPPLWTTEGSVESSSRKAISISEQFSLSLK